MARNNQITGAVVKVSKGLVRELCKDLGPQQRREIARNLVRARVELRNNPLLKGQTVNIGRAFLNGNESVRVAVHSTPASGIKGTLQSIFGASKKDVISFKTLNPGKLDKAIVSKAESLFGLPIIKSGSSVELAKAIDAIDDIERAKIEAMGIKYPKRGVVAKYTSQSVFKSDSPLVNEAMDVAKQHHYGVIRKGSDIKTPYINHPVSVAQRIKAAGMDNETVAASLLHDTIEDAGGFGKAALTGPQIKAKFGDNVAKFVEEVSVAGELKKLPWLERQEIYFNQIQNATPQAKAISAADKTSNMWSMIQGLNKGQDIFKFMKGSPEVQIEKFQRLKPVYAGAVPDKLYREYVEAADLLTKKINARYLVAN